MKWLSRTINLGVREGGMKHYSTKRGALQVNHLLFVDAILLFSKDCLQTFDKLLSILIHFCDLSGQVLNPAKCQILFSKHISEDNKVSILKNTKFKEGILPTTYLGAPLLQGRVKKVYFDYLLENMQKIVSGWMKNLLSMGGRLTLIKSLLSSVSLHVMYVLLIPKGS